SNMAHGNIAHVLRRAWRRLERVGGAIPLRLPGLLLLVAALVVAWRANRVEADYLLYPAGLAAAGLVVLCALAVAIGAALLRRGGRRGGIPDSLETPVATPTTFGFPRFASWPLLEARMRWEAPAGIAVALEPSGREFVETVTAAERGRHARLVRRFTVEDVFG